MAPPTGNLRNGRGTQWPQRYAGTLARGLGPAAGLRDCVTGGASRNEEGTSGARDTWEMDFPRRATGRPGGNPGVAYNIRAGMSRRESTIRFEGVFCGLRQTGRHGRLMEKSRIEGRPQMVTNTCEVTGFVISPPSLPRGTRATLAKSGCPTGSLKVRRDI